MNLNSLERCATMALEAITREYPYHLSHRLKGPETITAPKALTPVFCGAYDWHSAVHGHWVLARMLKRAPDAGHANHWADALSHSLQPDKIERERAYLADHPGFERPYGIAWLLCLAAELVAHPHPTALRWREALAPLSALCADQLMSWLPKLPFPNRTGTHNQTAFSMALAWDWATQTKTDGAVTLLEERARDFFLEDRDYPLHHEPGGEDFLSASLGAAWMMTRVLQDPVEFERWLDRVMPDLGISGVLVPARCPDRTDGRLAHLDGLNLSRAWMLMSVADALPKTSPRLTELHRLAAIHRERGLESISGNHYAGTHWLGTFALYLEEHTTE